MIYTANVARTNINGTARFDINILYGGVDVGSTPGVPEISLTLTPLVVNTGRLITHTLDQYVHDAAHLYAKVTVLFDTTPAWLLEVFAQPDPDPTTPHVYWCSKTRLDPAAPIQIAETVN